MSRTPNDRNWVIDGDPFAVSDEELQYALAEATVILSRVGGTIAVVADREEIAPGMYQTVRYVFKWSSYAPAKRQEPVPEPVVEEPVAA